MQINRRRKREMEEFNGVYNADVPTYIVVHGWKSSTQSDTVQNIKDNYLATKECNVIGRRILENEIKDSDSEYRVFISPCSRRLAGAGFEQFLYGSSSPNTRSR